jgi:hypothetical protein
MKRPFRLYNAVTKKNLPHRNFHYKNNAHNAALVETRWAHVGSIFEVITTQGIMHGQYVRGVNDIKFFKGVGE